jgi:hypothetical protein
MKFINTATLELRFETNDPSKCKPTAQKICDWINQRTASNIECNVKATKVQGEKEL